MDERDEVMEALDDLIRVIEETTERNKAIIRRARSIKRERNRGLAYRDIASVEKRPLIVELIGDNLRDLTDASSRFRRAEAKALHREGVTMERIAELFGVTRQRISAVLASAGSSGDASRGGRAEK